MQILQKIKSNSDYKRLFENFISLSILQGLNYILPLVTFPYLVRVLGVEKFGLLSFATATIAYFQILTDYGFNLSATREVAINRDNKEKLNEIFSSVMIIKFGLLIISFLLLSVLVFSFEKFRQDWLVYYLSFGMVLGQALFPVWFFQGMERMKYITFLNILAKGLFTIAIFVFVKQQSDYWQVPLLNSMGFILAGVLSLWIIYKDLNISFKFVGFENILRELKEGWYIFISTVAISLYTVSTTFILGIFTNNIVVGYYAAAEKLIMSIRGLLMPMYNSVYPYLSKLLHNSKEKGISFINKMSFYTGLISLAISLCLYFLSSIIVNLVLGDQYNQSIEIIKILSFFPFVTNFGIIFGSLTTLNLGYKSAYSKILILAGLINFSLAFLLAPHYLGQGVAIALMICESFIAISFFLYLRYKK